MFPLIAFILLFARAQPQLAPAPQQAPPNMKAQQAQAESGLENPWDVRNIIDTIQKETDGLRPILAELNPQQWYDQKGAPSTYISEWHTAQKQLDDIALSTRLLSQKTDSLSLALDEYFRLEALDVTSRTLQEGARKYAVRAVADRLDQFVARNFNNRERLRDYLRDLAANQEQDFKIADQEAQRCRGMISQEPASNLKKPRKH
ncbi:MAG: hypothetical protein JO033_02320 [Acidobacteriaceae bacterium]|nr:hypothetical protein [Acidobacteriaceae bacterium]MBV9501605.1 hypothetical protein [Acidobacteriaceae bacterium]